MPNYCKLYILVFRPSTRTVFIPSCTFFTISHCRERLIRNTIITRHDNLGDIANNEYFCEIFLLIIETVKSRMGIDGLGEHLGGEGEDVRT